MATSKVILNNEVLIDLTQDTVNSSSLLSGVAAHDAAGESITGNIASQGAQTITPTTSDQTISSGVFLSGVQTIKGDANLIAANIAEGVTIFDVAGTHSGGIDTSDATLTSGAQMLSGVTAYARGSKYTGSIVTKSSSDLTRSGATITAPAGYYASAVSSAVPNGSATTPAKTITATPAVSINSSTGVVTATVSTSSSVTPTVSAGYVSSGTAGTITASGTSTLSLTTQAGSTISPTESVQTAVGSGKYTIGDIKIGAISSTYVGSGVTQRSSADLSTNGSIITAPSGYYAAVASKSISAGSATTPATTISVTPGITISAGGLITASATGSSSITPTVTAGYVGSGTAGTVSVSGSKTSQLSTQAAATITPTESEQTAVASGKYTTGIVKVGAISSTYVGSGVTQRSSADLSASGSVITAPSGYYAAAASKAVASGSAVINPTFAVSPIGIMSVNNTTGVVTASYESAITPDVSFTAGYISSIQINSVGYEINDTLELSTQAGKTVTPTESEQTAVASAKFTTGPVKVGAISSTYVGSGITQRSSADLSASGSVITAPAGYYSASASKAIDGGSATTPAKTISVTPTISVSASGLITATATGSSSITPTVSAGYVSSGTAGTISVSGSNTSQLSTQAAVTITPTESEQTAVASGKYTTGIVKVGAVSSTYVGTGVTQRSSADLGTDGSVISVPSGYYAATASKSVEAGSATTPAKTISVTPGITISTSGLITATVTGSSSITPTVSAGYVSAGTAGTVSVSGSNTSQLTVQGAQTITPGTSDQTISSGIYLTGIQTIAGDADLIAENIRNGVTIFGVSGILATIPSGGSQNDILRKATSSDYDTEWIAPRDSVRVYYGTSTSVVTSPQEGDICLVYET